MANTQDYGRPAPQGGGKPPRTGWRRLLYWLTVLGDDALTRLGGAEEIAQRLGPACQVHLYPTGAILLAGDVPQLGDGSRAIVPDEYRRIAQTVRPIRFSGYKRGLFVLGGGEDEREETRKWLQRFN